jgi:hypothetical protein
VSIGPVLRTKRSFFWCVGCKPELGSVVRWSPLETQLLASVGAIPQVHVDEGLVGHADARTELSCGCQGEKRPTSPSAATPLLGGDRPSVVQKLPRNELGLGLPVRIACVASCVVEEFRGFFERALKEGIEAVAPFCIVTAVVI